MNKEYVSGDSDGLAPILVKLYDQHRLYTLAHEAKNNSQTSCQELAATVGSLVGEDLTLQQQELVSDVLMGILRQAEKDLRETMAIRLATTENAPLRLVLALANDEIDVARHVLQNSPVLSDQDLIYIIKSQTGPYWREIARRASLGGDVIALLAETRDVQTARLLIYNEMITIPDPAMGTLADIARTVEDLSVPLLCRKESSDALIRKIYKYASANIRAQIVRKFDLNEQERASVDDAAASARAELIERHAQGNRYPWAPSAKTVETAQKRYLSGAATRFSDILDILKKGNIPSFIAHLSLYTDIDVPRLHDLMCASEGRGLAVLARALNLSKPDFVTIFLLTQRMRSNSKLVDHQTLSSAITSYNRIRTTTARKLIRGSVH